MDMFEEARAMSGTIKLCNITQEKLAKQMGVSQSYIANKLRLLNFSPYMQKKIIESKITERHARSLLRIKSEEEQNKVLDNIIEKNLTVRECEAKVDEIVDLKAPVLIKKAEQLNKINTFSSTLKKSIETLCSNGIDAEERISYYGTKMYITLCIKDI